MKIAVVTQEYFMSIFIMHTYLAHYVYISSGIGFYGFRVKGFSVRVRVRRTGVRVRVFQFELILGLGLELRA